VGGVRRRTSIQEQVKVERARRDIHGVGSMDYARRANVTEVLPTGWAAFATQLSMGPRRSRCRGLCALVKPDAE